MQDDTQTQPVTEPVTEETNQDTKLPQPDAQESSDEPVEREDQTSDNESATVSASTEPDETTESHEATGSSDTQKAFSIMQVEDLINRQMADIDKLRDEVKVLKSSFDDAFKNDAKYRELDEKVKEQNKLKKQYVQGMKKDAAIQQAEQNYITKKDDLKDLQTGLSEYLREYNRVSGMTQFETQDGQMLEIVQVFKLVKK